MMAQFITAHGLYDALKAEGFELPKECRDVRIVFAVDGATMIQYECWLTTEDHVVVGKAMMRMGQRKNDA
jgi:hypothetical protein